MHTDTKQNKWGFNPQSVFISVHPWLKSKNKNNYTGLTGMRE